MIITLILLFTVRGGIKTIIWTDTLQTTFMLTALIMSFIMVGSAMDLSVKDLFSTVWKSDYSGMIYTDSSSPYTWWKQLLGGMFICIAMTGLDPRNDAKISAVKT